MPFYLDTSVLLRKLLGEKGSLKEWGAWDACYTSEITLVEAHRALDRLRLLGQITDEEIAQKAELLRNMLKAIGVIPVDSLVLKRSMQSFPTILGTLDAIHLASAALFKDNKKTDIVLLTHDRQLGLAAKAIGLETRGF